MQLFTDLQNFTDYKCYCLLSSEQEHPKEGYGSYPSNFPYHNVVAFWRLLLSIFFRMSKRICKISNGQVSPANLY